MAPQTSHSCRKYGWWNSRPQVSVAFGYLDRDGTRQRIGAISTLEFPLSLFPPLAVATPTLHLAVSTKFQETCPPFIATGAGLHTSALGFDPGRGDHCPTDATSMVPRISVVTKDSPAHSQPVNTAAPERLSGTERLTSFSSLPANPVHVGLAGELQQRKAGHGEGTENLQRRAMLQLAAVSRPRTQTVGRINPPRQGETLRLRRTEASPVHPPEVRHRVPCLRQPRVGPG